LRPALPTIYDSVEDIDLNGAYLAGANLRDSFLADANLETDFSSASTCRTLIEQSKI